MILACVLILSTILVIAGRALVPGHKLTWAGTYEAFAHIWVGWTITVGYYEWRDNRQEAWLSIILLIVATVYETVMFLNRPKDVPEKETP